MDSGPSQFREGGKGFVFQPLSRILSCTHESQACPGMIPGMIHDSVLTRMGTHDS